MTDILPALAQALTKYHPTLRPFSDNGHLIIIEKDPVPGHTNLIIIYQENDQIIIDLDTKDIPIQLADPELIQKLEQIIEKQ